ncbi:ankyrin repeat domain-containing protein [Thalassospiraceae bacterium LMO-JJ14]|nr:ankyrin repeat domain-containing protein [Thalassospiraceae bacterium LMO-JJ14]
MTSTKMTAKMTEQEFMDAAARGDDEAVRAGLEQGLKADTTDQYGNTALMMACARAQSGVCKTLLEAGASADHKNKYGLGPRNWISWAENDSTIRNMLG